MPVRIVALAGGHGLNLVFYLTSRIIFARLHGQIKVNPGWHLRGC